MKRTALTLASFAALVAAVPAARAQTAYGINATGSLFRFDVSNPGTVTNVGQITNGIGAPIAPVAIDFNPADGTLFGLFVNSTDAQLITINTSTAASVARSSGIGLSGTMGGNSFNLANSSYGFDVNPKTLQADGSIRIRLVSTNGSDIRINSATGAVANVDPTLNFAAGNPAGTGTGTPSVVAAAYTNNIAQLATAGGSTTLYDFSDTTDSLYTQNPPNNGTLNFVASLGINITAGSGFDIFTSANGTTNTGFFTDGTTGTLYRINDLTTGVPTVVGTFGSGALITDLAVQPVPEPSTYAMILGATILGAGWLRRTRRTAPVGV